MLWYITLKKSYYEEQNNSILILESISRTFNAYWHTQVAWGGRAGGRRLSHPRHTCPRHFCWGKMSPRFKLKKHIISNKAHKPTISCKANYDPFSCRIKYFTRDCWNFSHFTPSVWIIFTAVLHLVERQPGLCVTSERQENYSCFKNYNEVGI